MQQQKNGEKQTKNGQKSKYENLQKYQRYATKIKNKNCLKMPKNDRNRRQIIFQKSRKIS